MFNRSKSRRFVSKSPKTVGYVAFAICIVVSAFIIKLQLDLRQESRNNQIDQIMEQVASQIDLTIRNSYPALISLSLTIDDSGIPQNFDSIASQLVESNPYLDVLELVPNGVIEYVYPLEGNKEVLGYNILEDPDRRVEAMMAVERRRVYFAGPLRLKQGGMAVIGRLPIYRNTKFWGFSAVIIYLETLLEASGIDQIDREQFNVQLSKVNPTTGLEEFFPNTQERVKESEGKSIVFPEGDWKLYLEFREKSTDVYLVALWMVIGLLASAGCGLLIYLLLKIPSDELEKLNLQLKTHLENSPLGLVEYDQNLVITRWSHQCSKIFGWTEDEVLSQQMDAFNLIHKDDLEQAQETARDLMGETGTGNISYNRVYAKNGDVVHCLWYNSVVKDSKGQTLSVMSLVQDITEQKNMEAEQQRSEAQLNLIFDSTNDMMFLLAVDGPNRFSYLSVNQPFLEMAGSTLEDVVGGSVQGLLNTSKDSELPRMLEEVVQTLQPVSYYQPVHVKKGHIHTETTLSPIQDSSGNCVNILGVTRDVTLKRKHELQLQKSFDLTREQNERLLNFSYIVSHNLRTHSSNISGIIDLLATATDKSQKEKLMNYLKVVSNTLNETMGHLNEVVNIQTNMNIALSTLNLSDQIEKTIDLLREKIAEKGAMVRNNVPHNVEITFNTSYLESVLLNFIANALKYSHPDRAPVVTLSCYHSGEWLVLSIADNGHGIDLNRHGDSLFGMYKRFNTDKEGKGLGLFITKNQVEAMGGKIEVKSEIDKGTTFEVFFNMEVPFHPK